MAHRSWPWHGPETDKDGPDEMRERMSPHPDDESRMYDRAMRTTRTEHALQGDRHPVPGEVRKAVVEARTAGAPGTARATITSEALSGVVIAFHVGYPEATPPSTDVRISRVGSDDEAREILLVPECSTDGYHSPNSAPMWRPEPTSFAFVPYVLEREKLEVRVTDSDPDLAIRVTVFLHELTSRPAGAG